VFAKRLKWFVILMIAVALVIIGRLVDIQVVRAAHYEALADRILTRSPEYLTAPRGSILDRNGEVLLSDEPASDISMRYEALLTLMPEELPKISKDYLKAAGRSLRKRGRFPADMPDAEIITHVEAQIDSLLERLSELTGISREDLVQRAERIRRQVESIKADVQSRSPTTWKIKEEECYHALIGGIDEELALAVRIELEPEHPWLAVVPSSRRVAHGADALVHVLGRLGAASPSRIAADPLRDDELCGLMAGDQCGVSGVERLAELELRGVRGRVMRDFDRTETDRIDPVRGADVTLTIDADLQRKTLAILKEAVDGSEHPAGGAAVILDVATREVLALVSYPVYSYDDYWDDYAHLIRDNRWLPTRFRAVAEAYPPGSTCKVIALYGGLAEGVVSPDEQIRCTGHFLPNQPNKFRCWIYNQYGTTHGLQKAEDAIRNSCNIFFYTVGDRLGVDRLCKWFSAFGFGQTQGTGLIEETLGTVPTSAWIEENRTHDPRVRPADAWNYSIGQGEVLATPLQAANVAATMASGRWEPVKLARDSQGNVIGGEAGPSVTFDERHMHLLRSGMWRVVNEPGATAYRHARLESDDYVMCGKTGSAQAQPRPIKRRWFLEWPDDRRETVIGGLIKEDILAKYPTDDGPTIVGYRTCERYPALGADDNLPTHAWFIGYTQPKSTPRGAVPNHNVYAIAVIIEYGGSGGRVAGPAAKAIAELLVEGEWRIKNSD
jgi:cell division protein FtsI/penicillin-binding protein 2